MKSVAARTLMGSIIIIMTYILQHMNELFVILSVFMILDYITGIIYGMFRNGGFDRRKGLKGFVKKMMYLVLILVAILADYFIYYMAKEVGWNFGIQGALSLSVYVYLIGTEGLSIIQNVILLGVPVPEILKKAFCLIIDDSGNMIKGNICSINKKENQTNNDKDSGL